MLTWPEWPLNPVSWPRPRWAAWGGERRHVDGNVTVFGAPEHRTWHYRVSEGRSPSKPDEVASSTMGRHLGDTVEVGARRLRVVGIVPNSTALG